MVTAVIVGLLIWLISASVPLALAAAVVGGASRAVRSRSSHGRDHKRLDAD